MVFGPRQQKLRLLRLPGTPLVAFHDDDFFSTAHDHHSSVADGVGRRCGCWGRGGLVVVEHGFRAHTKRRRSDNSRSDSSLDGNWPQIAGFSGTQLLHFRTQIADFSDGLSEHKTVRDKEKLTGAQFIQRSSSRLFSSGNSMQFLVISVCSLAVQCFSKRSALIGKILCDDGNDFDHGDNIAHEIRRLSRAEKSPAPVMLKPCLQRRVVHAKGCPRKFAARPHILPQKKPEVPAHPQKTSAGSVKSRRTPT